MTSPSPLPMGMQAVQALKPRGRSRTCAPDIESLPWVPAGTPGKWSRPLRFLPGDRGFVELLRMDPGVLMPSHRHTGEVHAWNLSGLRRLDTGETVGPGGYTHEPPGNIDWWRAVGDEPLVALVVVTGAVEFIGPHQAVVARVDARTQREALYAWCAAQGLAVPDLGAEAAR